MPTSGHKTSRNFSALVARRMWTVDDKRRLVDEMSLPGANVSEISRRHGVANSLLYRWRQDAVAVADTAAIRQRPSDIEPGLAPVFVSVAIAPPRHTRLPTPKTIAPCACIACSEAIADQCGKGLNSRQASVADASRVVAYGPMPACESLKARLYWP